MRTHGLKGEIVAELLTDFPERFEELDELILVSPSGERKLVQARGVLVSKGPRRFEARRIRRRRAREALVGYDFAVPESERVPLEEDEFYDWELEGCTVKVGDKSIGQVRSVMKTGGAEILVVADDSGQGTTGSAGCVDRR